MGDCLLLTSPVRALKEEFPDFRISVVVESRFAACFDGNPDFAEGVRALIIDKDNNPAWRYGALQNLPHDYVVAHFESLWGTHPLADLGEQ